MKEDEVEKLKKLMRPGETMRDLVLRLAEIDHEPIKVGRPVTVGDLDSMFKFGKDESKSTVEARQACADQLEKFRIESEAKFTEQETRRILGDEKKDWVSVRCPNCGHEFKSAALQWATCPKCFRLVKVEKTAPETEIVSAGTNEPESAEFKEIGAVRGGNISYTTPKGGETSATLEKRLNEAYLRLHGKFRYRKV
jgi:predicted Zn-ribbon and HTH transcriptional regulator